MKKMFRGVVIVSLLLTSCSDAKEDETAEQIDPVGESSTTESTLAPEAAIIDDRPIVDTKKGGDPFERYLAYTEAFDVAAGPPFADPEYAPLLELMTDRQAEFTLNNALEIMKEENLVTKFPDNSQDEHVLSEIGGDAIIPAESKIFQFADCYVTDSFEEDLDDGSTIQPGLRTSLDLIEMRLDDEGEWRLDGISVKETYEGIGPCANQS